MVDITRRDAMTLAAMALLTPAFATRALAQSQGQSVLKVAPHASLRLLDPLTTTAYITRNHGYMVFDTLFGVDSAFSPQPQMVETWSVSDDKLSYGFTLREGLLFHDGSPVTAADCVASLARWMQRDLTGGRLAKVLTKMEAGDAKTFTLTLSEPFGPLIDALAKPSSLVPFMMPKRLAETPSDKSIEEAIGSGPFTFVAEEFQPGVKVVYERFADYKPRPEPASYLAGGKVAKVDRVEWITMPDTQTAVNALEKDEIDMIESTNADTVGLLRDAPGVEIQKLAITYEPVIRFNWLQPPFDNVKIRQAAQQAITQRDFMDVLIGDPEAYRICGALFGCGTPLETEAGAVGTGEPNYDRARALLEEGGYKGEKVVVLNASDIASFAGLAPLTAQILRSIGMEVEVASMDFSTYLARRNRQVPVSEGGWNVAFGVWSTIDLASPLANLNLDGRGAPGYAGWSKDEKIEALKGDYARATSLAEQQAIAKEIQERAYELVFYIPLGTYFGFSAHRADVSGLPPAPLAVFWDVEKT